MNSPVVRRSLSNNLTTRFATLVSLSSPYRGQWKLANGTGFFYVTNYDISQEEVDRQFALGREFYSLPLEEKLKYYNAKDLESGEYNGYRPAGNRK
jgi:hypothetical protein